ncbi:MAG TPA: adenylate/guanylate cyclase domain-containing protein [Anaerolineales bacterium]|nr:adenylate/guanylate cyclase domain-containing protein [Anaerolineales bacterium]
MANKSQIGKSNIPKWIPVWLMNPRGIACGVTALYILAYIAWTKFQWGATESFRLIPSWDVDRNFSLISDLAYQPVSLFATLVAWRIVRIPAFDSRLRRAWFILGLAVLAQTFGDTAWFYLKDILGQEPFPSVADIFFLAFYPLALWGLLSLPSAPIKPAERWRILLDLAIIMITAWMGIWFFIISPTAAQYESGHLDQILAAAYPVGDLMLLGGIFALLFRGAEGTVRSMLILYMIGLSLNVAGDLFYAYASLNDTYVSGGWMDLSWILAYWFFALAAVRQEYVTESKRGSLSAKVFSRASLILPLTAIVLGYGMLIWVASSTSSANSATQGLFAGAGLLTLFVVGRQVVSVRDNQMLNGELNKHLSELDQAYSMLNTERDRAERLLLNVLPEAVANRLKLGQATIADSFAEVTVLFADIVDFTSLSARISAEQLVQMLNQVFSAFDQLAEKHGLEKIKTIGDAYMIVSGLNSPYPNRAEAVAEMALDMHEELRQMSESTGIDLKVRIGIDTGPVVAGVIGTKKFIYDLWGDTVNTASRMESQGLAGRIQVTQRLYERLMEKYQFEKRGLIQVKGKGEINAYLLDGRHPVDSPTPA